MTSNRASTVLVGLMLVRYHPSRMEVDLKAQTLCGPVL